MGRVIISSVVAEGKKHPPPGIAREGGELDKWNGNRKTNDPAPPHFMKILNFNLWATLSHGEKEI